jgi:hypothetical protein
MKLFSVGSSSSTDSIFWVGEREVMESDDDRDIATPPSTKNNVVTLTLVYLAQNENSWIDNVLHNGK